MLFAPCPPRFQALMLIEFFAPWCRHCQALAPEFDTASIQLRDDGIKLAKVDCTQEQSLCSDYQIEGFPTLKVFRNGVPAEYGGSRKADGIVSYMRKQALPPTSYVDASNITAFTKKEKVVAIAYLPSADSPEAQAYKKVAEANREAHLFGFATTPSAAEETKASVPSLVLYRSFDEPEITYDGDAKDADAIAAFIKAQSVPLVDEVGPENFMSYAESGLPLAYYFTQPTYEGKNADLDVIKQIAKEYKGKINFVWIDADKFVNHAKALNVQGEDWPAFVIQDLESAGKYPFPMTGSKVTDGLADWVKEYSAGKVSPSIKSEPVPVQSGPVYTLVADEFDKVVFDDAKDVLVEFYAPWCGHCKKLAPVYEELASKFASPEAASKIVIAKMDATANDVPPSAGFQIRSFPTIKFKKAGSKEFIDFTGDRSLDSFVDFIAEHGANKASPSDPDLFEDASAPGETQAHEDL